jgi:predicted nucleic acid-binding protein
MKERVFCDTNILIYHFTKDKGKYEKTNAIITNPSIELVTSTKVLSEFSNVCLKKGFVNNKLKIKEHLAAIAALFQVQELSIPDIIHGLDIAERYQISFYHSLIVANALHAACKKLYTEDLHNGLIVEKKLKIVNPFK